MAIDIYKKVSDEILAALEKDIVPWRRPWQTNFHKNLANDYEYRGINQMLCELYMIERGFKHPMWVTYKGARKLGGYVRQGEKGNFIIFWKWVKKEDNDGEDASFPILRYYNVFNVVQCEDIEIPKLGENEHNPNDEAEKIIKKYKDIPPIKFGGNSAYYSPPNDEVGIPNPEQFVDSDAYYATMFHELVHSTGHKKRLNRDEITKGIFFGTEDYSREELVAEIGSAMLCAITGIDPSTRERSTSYIHSWKQKLEDDKKIILTAASRAQKASEYIQGAHNEP